jgi:hypothetical protein
MEAEPPPKKKATAVLTDVQKPTWNLVMYVCECVYVFRVRFVLHV